MPNDLYNFNLIGSKLENNQSINPSRCHSDNNLINQTQQFINSTNLNENMNLFSQNQIASNNCTNLNNYKLENLTNANLNQLFETNLIEPNCIGQNQFQLHQNYIQTQTKNNLDSIQLNYPNILDFNLNQSNLNNFKNYISTDYHENMYNNQVGY